MPHTRVEILRFSIAFALIGKKARGRKLALTEEERYAIADHVIRDMRKYGQWAELDQEIETPVGLTGPSTAGPKYQDMSDYDAA
jgi:hypothetical protein